MLSFSARFSEQAADTIRNIPLFNLSGKFHNILEEITFFLKLDDLIMLIYSKYANFSQVFVGFPWDHFFSGKPILYTFKWDIIDHTTVNTSRDILINMRYGQFCLYLLYRGELKEQKSAYIINCSKCIINIQGYSEIFPNGRPNLD